MRKKVKDVLLLFYILTIIAISASLFLDLKINQEGGGVDFVYSESENTSLAGSIKVLKIERSISIEEAKEKYLHGEFLSPGNVFKTSGFEDEYVWVRFEINIKPESESWVVSSPNTGFNTFEVHGPYASDIYEEKEQKKLAKAEVFEANYFSFKFSNAYSGKQIVYIKTRSFLPESYEYTITNLNKYQRQSGKDNIRAGVSYGLLIGMVTCGILMYLIFHERLYLYNVASTSSAILTISVFSGHFPKYIYLLSGNWLPYAHIVFPALWIISSGLFSIEFLELKDRNPITKKIILVLIFSAALSVIFGFFGYIKLALVLVHVAALFGPLVVLQAALRSYLQGYIPSLYYFSGLIVLFAAAVSISLAHVGPIDYINKAAALQIGASLEALIFFFALGSRISRLRALNGVLNKKTIELQNLALIDPLTGALNRNGWRHFAQLILEKGTKSAVLLVDLDGFKAVNDNFGHPVGDLILQQTVERIKAELYDNDLIARFGGDEFLIFLRGSHDNDILEARLEFILDAISQPHDFLDTKTPVSASIGVALYPNHGTSLSQLMHAADKAMYHVKSNGKAGFAVYADANSR